MIASQTGVHQGCPLGPTGFALGIHSILERLGTQSGLMWQSWYLDDGILLGDAASVSTAFHLIQAEMARIGLKVNPTICELWGPGAAYCNNLQQVTIVPWDPGHGITILGVPINYPGANAQNTKAWNTATEKLYATLERVTGLTDAQTAHHLLRKCLDGCRVNHLLRASDPYTCEEQVNRCDAAILGAFEDIVAHRMNTNQKAQASLPLATGGCGICIPSVIRPAARISALATFYTNGRHTVAAPTQEGYVG
jgi:hypothetical protein